MKKSDILYRAALSVAYAGAKMYNGVEPAKDIMNKRDTGDFGTALALCDSLSERLMQAADKLRKEGK